MSTTETNLIFLNGGGEMATLIGQHDWSGYAVDIPEEWPQSLQHYLSLLLNSPFPMFLFWGPQHTCFYNDAYIPMLGHGGKHPGILGMAGEEAWPETWHLIGPVIKGILNGGAATGIKKQLLPALGSGEPESMYYTAGYSAVIDESGSRAGVLITCMVENDSIPAPKKLKQKSQHWENIFTQINTGIAQTDTDGRFTEVNNEYCRMLGYTRSELLKKNIADVTHSEDMPRNYELLKLCLQDGKNFFINKRYIRKDGSIIWVNNSVALVTDPAGKKHLAAICIDNTAEKLHEMRLAESEARFRSLIEQAPVATMLMTGPEMRIEIINEAMVKALGKSYPVIGLTIGEALPEMADQRYLAELDAVYATGNSIEGKAAPAAVMINGTLHHQYFDYTYKPVRDSNGNIYGIISMIVDVTEQVLAQEQIEKNESRFRKLVKEAPVAIGLFTGPRLIIESPNQAFIDVIGRGPHIAGQPLEQVMPELKNQPLLRILEQVFHSGELVRLSEAKVTIMSTGKPVERYFNIIFSPIFENGVVTAVLDISVDVTEQILARQKVEESEITLKAAIELAELATWHLDLRKKLITYSPRFQKWTGVEEKTLQLQDSPIIHNKDKARVTAAFEAAVNPAGNGIFDEVYTIVHSLTGQERIIHATGSVMFDGEERAVSVSGTAQDVTLQYSLQLALEQQVTERTEELAATAAKLKSANEELAETNTRLAHSNKELAQYAYVASHDLQEPLRKIRMFTGMLSNDKVMPQSLRPLVSRIDKSAGRMSLLIRDLLEFSQLLKAEVLVKPLKLDEIIANVISDFELMIEEKQGRITVAGMPSIQAIGLQMNQLFYNLIGNALKFSKPGVPPVIQIEVMPASKAEINFYITRPYSFARYYHITISDNGIGFDTAYSEQIFEVFKRLHNRDAYPGSGIGLALCRRIANNHNGILYATSTPGVGSVFHLLLPDRQQEPKAVPAETVTM